MKKINLNEVYVLDSPKKAVLSFVVVDNKFPLTQPEHDRIYDLSCVSDVFFIFRPGCSINPEKFSTLYSGSGYIMSSENLAGTLVRIMEYSYQIFNSDRISHVGYLVTSVKYLPEVNKNKIISISSGITTSPIYISRRLGPEEFYDIYSEKGLDKLKNNIDRMYSLWTSSCGAIFLREKHLRSIVTLNEKYIQSFSWDDPRYFVASALKYLGYSNIEGDIMTLDVNDTEGKE